MFSFRSFVVLHFHLGLWSSLSEFLQNMKVLFLGSPFFLGSLLHMDSQLVQNHPLQIEFFSIECLCSSVERQLTTAVLLVPILFHGSIFLSFIRTMLCNCYSFILRLEVAECEFSNFLLQYFVGYSRPIAFPYKL